MEGTQQTYPFCQDARDTENVIPSLSTVASAATANAGAALSPSEPTDSCGQCPQSSTIPDQDMFSIMQGCTESEYFSVEQQKRKMTTPTLNEILRTVSRGNTDVEKDLTTILNNSGFEYYDDLNMCTEEQMRGIGIKVAHINRIRRECDEVARRISFGTNGQQEEGEGLKTTAVQHLSNRVSPQEEDERIQAIEDALHKKQINNSSVNTLRAVRDFMTYYNTRVKSSNQKSCEEEDADKVALHVLHFQQRQSGGEGMEPTKENTKLYYLNSMNAFLDAQKNVMSQRTKKLVEKASRALHKAANTTRARGDKDTILAFTYKDCRHLINSAMAERKDGM